LFWSNELLHVNLNEILARLLTWVIVGEHHGGCPRVVEASAKRGGVEMDPTHRRLPGTLFLSPGSSKEQSGSDICRRNPPARASNHYTSNPWRFSDLVGTRVIYSVRCQKLQCTFFGSQGVGAVELKIINCHRAMLQVSMQPFFGMG
jgi:hypothetical protein